MIDNQIVIKAVWDPEAKVWVAESDDVPGLVTEAESPGALIEKLKSLIPELLELNNYAPKGGESLELVVQYRGEDRMTVPVAA